MKALTTLLLLLLDASWAAYQPGTPGVAWTEEQASIIKAKIERLWQKSMRIVEDFDLGSDTAQSSSYVFDPDLTTVVPFYDECVSDEACDQLFARRLPDFAFNERKALRLAFHDCVPYADPNGPKGGCDGCLNLVENRAENHGLQHSVAILERLYMDVDFPKLKKGQPNLPASPYELGMSRADLWAFAGLLALDEFQKFTEGACMVKEEEAMCDDNSTSCYTPFPNYGRTMFKTGRVDCTPNPIAGANQQYLASRVEAQPDQSFNGQMTVDFFDQHFDMTGREALVLMGAHTVGFFNLIISKNAYSWMRGLEPSIQQRLFNNKYYKIMASRPQKVYAQCVGSMSDEAVEGHWHLMTNLAGSTLKRPDIWANETKLGRIVWTPKYNRGPNCALGSAGHDELDGEEWNRLVPGGIDFCCEEKAKGCGDSNSCPEECTLLRPNKERFIGVDMGFRFKWEIDDKGLPYGCSAFENKWTGERLTEPEFRAVRGLGPHGCPMQTLDDGTGQELWQTVEHFADSNEAFINEFVGAFQKMQQNGYDSLEQGPVNFWSHF